MNPEHFMEQVIFPALNEADSIVLVDPLGVTSPGAVDAWLVEMTDGSKLILTVEATR